MHKEGQENAKRIQKPASSRNLGGKSGKTEESNK
jgi:hypothetical protein